MTSHSFASGFGIFTQGASGLGQGNAVVAHTTGPSSVFFNPALINEVPGTQVEIGTTAVFPNREFKSDATGAREETVDNVYFPFTFYVTHAVNDDLSLGFGVNNTFGLGTEWPKDWEGRYLATRSTITTFNFNPVVSYRVSPYVTLAAGVDVLYLDAELTNKIPFSPDPATDGEQELSGDGTGYGYNLGLLVKLSDQVSLGAGYRSEIELDIEDADVTFRNIPAAALALFPKVKADTTIMLPAQFVAGIAVKPMDRLTVEAGMRWEEWSSFDELKIELSEPVAFPPMSEKVVPRDWDDTIAFNIGANYRLNDTFSLLAGYLYGNNPIPTSTYEPAIPDSDTHLFTIGSDIELKPFKIAVSYGYQKQEKRDKTNDIGSDFTLVDPNAKANGTYENDIHLAAVSLTYRF